jgi:hypothetical protein
MRAKMKQALAAAAVLWFLSSVTSHAATVEESGKPEAEVVLYSSLNNEQIVTLVQGIRPAGEELRSMFGVR